MVSTRVSHSSHWGAFDAIVESGEVTAVNPYGGDADPSPLLANIPGSTRHKARVATPFIRAGWLANGPGPTTLRGRDEMVPVSWETATRLLSAELRRVLDQYGPGAIFGGSYGWSSAGRFHHAQSQLHRFLNVLGGYISSVNTYSNAAGEVILDRVTGSMRDLITHATSWELVAEHTDLVVAFGGIPLKNTAVSPGGASRHRVRGSLNAAAARGTEFVYFSPVADDLSSEIPSTWHSLRPGTDVAVMLGLAWVLIEENLLDRDFLSRYTVGFERFERYVRGEEDGAPKTPEWAESISTVNAPAIRALARRLVSGRTLVNTSWSLQRSQHGEQPPWMALTLAAMIGQIGLPGGGYGFGYGSMASVGETTHGLGSPTLSQGRNGVEAFIPVARLVDMLLKPGEPFDYNGQRLTYPDARIGYWAGGNPFHHHQDINRLREGIGRPDTVVVHDPYWTATARHADIVLPSTVTLERDDIGATGSDPVVVAMKSAVEPYADARNDFAIFSDLTRALGVEVAFTEGRDEQDWPRHLYETWRRRNQTIAPELPDFNTFWTAEYLELPEPIQPAVMLEAFRADPVANPLRTPSGKIEIFSETIDSFKYDDCPGHPTWLEPDEWLGSGKASTFPMQLVANNPRTRLHSQLDMGSGSQASKIRGREPARMHPDDASVRGISDGDIVRIFNERGSCLAGVHVSAGIRPGVVQLSTGAWFDPIDASLPDSLCVHGNPNVLTEDIGTSKLAQGCSGQLSWVEIERWTGPIPPIRAFEPPEFVTRG